jgi:AsmA family protein
VDLTAKVKDKHYIMANGTGHFDFAVWPGDMNADVFDLWAVNLLAAVVSSTDKEEGSKVNCAVASFKLNDGIMQQKVLFADTSRMQIEGTADINFKTKRIELYAEPKAKRPEFFSLATPIKVKGSFADFGIGINPVRLTGSVLRFVTSPVLVPLHRLFSTDQPADGEVACAAAWQMRNTPKKP